MKLVCNEMVYYLVGLVGDSKNKRSDHYDSWRVIKQVLRSNRRKIVDMKNNTPMINKMNLYFLCFYIPCSILQITYYMLYSR